MLKVIKYVLVNFGCFKGIEWTGWLIQHSFIIVLQAGKIQNQGACWFFSWWELSSEWLPSSLCPYLVKRETERQREIEGEGGKKGGGMREKENPLASYFKGTNPIMRAPPSWVHLNLIIFRRPISFFFPLSF